MNQCGELNFFFLSFSYQVLLKMYFLYVLNGQYETKGLETVMAKNSQDTGDTSHLLSHFQTRKRHQGQDGSERDKAATSGEHPEI